MIKAKIITGTECEELWMSVIPHVGEMISIDGVSRKVIHVEYFPQSMNSNFLHKPEPGRTNKYPDYVDKVELVIGCEDIQ